MSALFLTQNSTQTIEIENNICYNVFKVMIWAYLL